MKKIFFLLALILYFSFSTEQSFAQEPEAVPGELIVKYKDGHTPDELKEKAQKRKARARSIVGALQNNAENILLRTKGEDPPEKDLQEIENVEKRVRVIESKELFDETPGKNDDELEDIEVVKASASIPVTELEKQYESLDSVEYAEPNYVLEAFSAPNDTFYTTMWGLSKLQIENAWTLTRGSNQVIVAVIDSGIDYNHEDIPRDIIKGRDTINGDDDPMDGGGHGTHVAGTIGAITDNSIGVSGINYNVRLMAVKALSDSGSGSLTSVSQAIRYAADNGAKVMNLSLGGEMSSPCPTSTRTIQEAIDYARGKGVTIVVAAGNSNKDSSTFVPASCNGVITVGATKPDDQRASYSNYGNVVDIAAPGGDFEFGGGCFNFSSCESKVILSTWPPNVSASEAGYGSSDNKYALLNGTSMATPHVAGVAALLLSVNPNLTPDQVEEAIKNTGDPINTDRPIGGKRLNAYRALLTVIPPTNTPSPIPTATSIPASPTPTAPTTPTTQPTSASTPTPTPLPPGDINRDGTINIQDYQIWRCEYLGNGRCENPASDKSADINNDGTVNMLDFGMWVNGFIR